MFTLIDSICDILQLIMVNIQIMYFYNTVKNIPNLNYAKGCLFEREM